MLKYPSDLSDEEWEILAPYVGKEKTGRPRNHDIRAIINGIRYVQRSGCQWRMMPKDFPEWSAVYYYFKLWRDNGRWLEIHDSLAEKVRVTSGRQPSPTVVIIDSQSVKTTQKGDQRGYDAGKKNQGS